MLHTDLSTSSTLVASTQRLSFPGCPQVHRTKGSPLQGPCHLWDPHITLLLILNLPLIQMGSQSICGLVSNHSSPHCRSTALQPCWPPCCSLSTCAKGVPTLGFFALHLPLSEMLVPLYACCSLTSKCQLIDTVPHDLLFHSPYPALFLPIAIFPI